MVSGKAKILIIDDEQDVCDVLGDELTDQGYCCTKVLNSNDALMEMVKQHFDVVLVDLRLPGVSGMEVLARIQSAYPDTSAIAITAVNNLETAVKAMKVGASDYIVKPFKLDRVNTSVRTLLENKERLSETRHKQTTKDSFNRMNAIAFGVQAKLELHDNHSQIVTQRTVRIAQQLGICEEEIQRWAAARGKLESERHKIMRASLSKLELSPLAQYIMGMTAPHLCRSECSESQN